MRGCTLPTALRPSPRGARFSASSPRLGGWGWGWAWAWARDRLCLHGDPIRMLQALWAFDVLESR